jgi:hypothetical protein
LGRSPLDLVVIGMAPSSEVPLDLMRGLSRTTWLARLDGSTVIARAVTAAPQHIVDSPLLVPVIGVREIDGNTWLLSEQVDGASVERLLGLATLTPAQAAWLAARTLAALAALHDAGLAHGRVHAGNVLVGRDGSIRLGDWALGPPTSVEARAADLAAAQAFIRALLRNATRPTTRHGGLLADLERLAAEPITDPADAACELDVAVDDAATVAGELGALVSAMKRTSTQVVTPAPLPPRLPHTRRPPPRRLPQRRWVAAVATLLVLAAAGVVAVLLARHHNAAAPAPPGSRAPSSRPPTSAPSPTPSSATARHVAAVAPRSAGFVHGVLVRPVTACRPGASCPVTVTIRMIAHSDVKRVDWRFVLVNPCTGARTDAPGGSMTAQPNWQHVFTTTSVPLPQAPSVSLVAMTTAPVRAASPPLTVPSGHAQC